MRTAEIKRNTAETQIVLKLDLDGIGKSDIATGCGFLDHMLVLFAKHGRFDLTVSCKGDTWVDDHHTVEDVGIALGDAFRTALGEKKGITRYGSQILPMDEALKVASASARFNLKAATASGGAPEMSELLEYVKTCSFEEIPEYFR